MILTCPHPFLLVAATAPAIAISPHPPQDPIPNRPACWSCGPSLCWQAAAGQAPEKVVGWLRPCKLEVFWSLWVQVGDLACTSEVW